MRSNYQSIIVYFTILTLYLLVIINTTGYHHPDEHFQIIEFAGLKAGWNTGYDLTWEYDSQIRPALQPYIALVVVKSAYFLEIEDPYVLSTLLRGLTAFFSFASILFFIHCFRPTIQKKYYLVFVLISFGLWFLPSINVRFSSETWSGLCLLLSVGLIQLNRQVKWHYLLTGVLFGLSFEFRFQTALAMVGIILWLMYVRRSGLKQLIYIILGSSIVILMGTILDSLFYGELVFTPWNYFKVNIIEDISSNYGTAPWYTYLSSILIAPTFLIGVAILFSLILLLIYDHKNILLWTTIPFVLFHSFVAHKELSFLFPLVNFLPVMLMQAYQLMGKKFRMNGSLKYIFHSLLIALLIINLGGLTMMLFKPAGNGSVLLMHYISSEYGNTSSLPIYCLKNRNPYVIGNAKGLKANFYTSENLIIKDITPAFLTHPKPNQLVVLPSGYVSEGRMLEQYNYKIEKRGIPTWITEMNKLYRVFNEHAVPLLYTQNNHDEED